MPRKARAIPNLLLERRGRIRFRVRVPFALRCDGQEVRGVTRNISLLGIAAYTNGPFVPAQSVQCLLEIPNESQPIVVHGTVTRCEQLSQAHPDGPYEMGVFFKEFPSHQEALLTKYLGRLAAKEETAIRAGYRAFKQKIAARRRRKRLEELRRRRRRLERLRQKRRVQARKKRLAAQRKKSARQKASA